MVDDERVFVDSFKRALRRLEPSWLLDVASSAEAGLWEASKCDYDVILLDWNLSSELTGLDVCKRLRERGCQCAILLLTAHGDVQDRIASIRAGADDHIVKLSSLNEVHARIKVVAARKSARDASDGAGAGSALLRLGPLQINLLEHRFSVSGKCVDLSRHQWCLMLRLLRSGGHPVSAETLARFAGIEPGAGHKNLANEIRRLRARLDDHEPGVGSCLVGYRGHGYFFREPSRAEPSRAEPSRAEPSRAEPSRADKQTSTQARRSRARVFLKNEGRHRSCSSLPYSQ
ncbi:MAG TPA: response regulator transcription factor [Polyangiaceae bacterium]|nr:response regulator transcription factor [Polyangiaceae bacterium]